MSVGYFNLKKNDVKNFGWSIGKKMLPKSILLVKLRKKILQCHLRQHDPAQKNIYIQKPAAGKIDYVKSSPTWKPPSAKAFKKSLSILVS